MFGDYAKQAAPDLLLAKHNDAHPTEIADLFGARLVVCQEIEGGRRLAEATVKQLTGGDVIKARHMREDFWSFTPTHKLFLAANHKPNVRGTDYAIWRRIRLIPFTVTFPEGKRDARLLERLLVERAGILRWAVDGCEAWRARGLEAPPEVIEATEEYRQEEDTFAGFLEDRCERGASFTASSADIYRAYMQWCETTSTRPLGRRSFAGQLQAHDFLPEKGTGGAREWKGLRLRDHEEERAYARRDGSSRDDDDGFRWGNA